MKEQTKEQTKKIKDGSNDLRYIMYIYSFSSIEHANHAGESCATKKCA